MELIADSIDLSAYMGGSDLTANVVQASRFKAKLHEVLRPREDGPKAPEMFSTKLAGRLDFRAGEVTAWAGYNGHRKSLFTGQVALDLCVQKQPTLMASFEMQPERTLGRMARQACGVSRPAGQDVDRLLQWTDGKLWMFDHLGRIKPEQCIAVCRYFAEKCAGAHVFIDSMMMVCASEESMDEQKQFMTDLVRVAQETGLHVHLVAHCRKPQAGEDKPPTKYELRGSAAISDQAHNVVTVWANKSKRDKCERQGAGGDAYSEPDAVISVEKQRNGAFEGKTSLWWDEASLRFMNDRTSEVMPYQFLAHDDEGQQ